MSDQTMSLLAEPFSISDDRLNTGLRGFPIGTCRTSAVSATEGVSYVGYPVSDLADLPCEDVIYLLLNRELPNEEQAKAFAADLGSRMTVSDEVMRALRAMPMKGHPMEWFVSGLVLLGMTEKTAENDYRQDALNVIAKTSTLIAAIFRIRGGWGDPIAPKAGLSFHENFTHMLDAPDATDRLSDLLRMFYVLHMDHGGGNLSTFVGKAIASSLTDTYSSLSGAMGALYGPRHGRANQECLNLVLDIGTSDEAEADKKIRERMAAGGLIYGFGHAVLRAEDPRATIQYAFGQEHYADDPNVATALTLRKVVPPILKENPKISNPYPNVDAISGSLLMAAGLKDPEFYTLLFGWSRVAGIAAQIVDERLTLRNGKGVPIYRPRFIGENQPARRR